MGFINVSDRTINAKLVYYGVGVGGKTTSLQGVHGILCPRNEVQLVSINTEEDSTLLFDFLPINLGNVGGFKIRIQGFTVPGQPKYKQMRKYVLAGADAVVFVVDSQRSRLQENLESLLNMRENLRSSSSTSEDVPIVLQYNKRDLPDILSEEELDKHCKFRPGIESFPSVATESQGVFEAFVHAAGLLVESKVALYGLGRGQVSPKDIAESARKKLWEICDSVRHDRGSVAREALPATKLAVKDTPTEVAQAAATPAPAPAPAAPAPKPPAKSKSKSKKAKAGDGEFAYELRDEVGVAPAAVTPQSATDANARTGEVLSDADLDIELSRAVDFSAPAASENPDTSLLDKTVQSNLELAQRYGELDEYKTLLGRKVNELVEVAQNTVHDLNRPLSAVRLMLSTLAKGYLGEIAEPVRQAVQNGLLAVTQMERLIRDLLDSSRLDHSGMRMTFANVDMTLLVAEVVRSLRYEVEEKDVHIRIEPMPVVLGDEWALTKVFMNLVGNAITYTHPDRPSTVRVWADDAGEEWQLKVQDNGIGIPSKDRDRLFRRFERGSNTGGISGTGLGLHIVKEILQGHGGHVSVESEEGKGTTFHLHLPKKPCQPPHSPVTETAERADL